MVVSDTKGGHEQACAMSPHTCCMCYMCYRLHVLHMLQACTMSPHACCMYYICYRRHVLHMLHACTMSPHTCCMCYMCYRRHVHHEPAHVLHMLHRVFDARTVSGGMTQRVMYIVAHVGGAQCDEPVVRCARMALLSGVHAWR